MKKKLYIRKIHVENKKKIQGNKTHKHSNNNKINYNKNFKIRNPNVLVCQWHQNVLISHPLFYRIVSFILTGDRSYMAKVNLVPCLYIFSSSLLALVMALVLCKETHIYAYRQQKQQQKIFSNFRIKFNVIFCSFFFSFCLYLFLSLPPFAFLFRWYLRKKSHSLAQKWNCVNSFE